jgi:hypothetical protein
MNAKFLGAAAAMSGLGLVSALGFVSPASATIVSVVYTGTVTSGSDMTGMFGPAGGDLAGDSYVARYVFDTTRGFTYASATNNYAYGGSGYGNASPAVSASVTIAGHSASISGAYASQIFGYNSGGFSEQYHDARDLFFNGAIYVDNQSQNYIYNHTATLPASITGTFTYNVGPNDTFYASVNFNTFDYNLAAYSQYAYAYASLSTLTVSSGVPEPSTWATMLLGFGALGFAGYRRSRRYATTPTTA